MGCTPHAINNYPDHVCGWWKTLGEGLWNWLCPTNTYGNGAAFFEVLMWNGALIGIPFGFSDSLQEFTFDVRAVWLDSGTIEVGEFYRHDHQQQRACNQQERPISCLCFRNQHENTINMDWWLPFRGFGVILDVSGGQLLNLLECDICVAFLSLAAGVRTCVLLVSSQVSYKRALLALVLLTIFETPTWSRTDAGD